MREAFLRLGFEERFEKILRVKSEIAQRMRRLGSVVGIATYGSATYGFNGISRGNMDDIDAFVFPPLRLAHGEFVDVVQEVIPGAGAISVDRYRKLQDGEYDILRFYGELAGVRLGFRVVPEEKLSEITTTSGCCLPLSNLADEGCSRIIEDVEQPLGGGTARKVTLLTRPAFESCNKLTVVLQYVLSSDRRFLGSLGRKLLTCVPLHDPAGRVGSALSSLWSIYVRESTQINPAASTEQLIDLIMRSERFSVSYRDDLRKKITRLRDG